jgi:hypothetical protein
VRRAIVLGLSALLALSACSDSKKSPNSASASSASAAAAQGDAGEFACGLLTKDDISKAIGQEATDPVKNGGGPTSVATDASASGSGVSPGKSRCRMQSTGSARATIVSWDVAVYATAQDAAEDEAPYFKKDDEAVEGIGDKAVVDANHQSATLRKGAVVVVFTYQDGSKSQEEYTAELKAGPHPASYVDAFNALMKAAAAHL